MSRLNLRQQPCLVSLSGWPRPEPHEQEFIFQVDGAGRKRRRSGGEPPMIRMAMALAIAGGYLASASWVRVLCVRADSAYSPRSP